MKEENAKALADAFLAEHFKDGPYELVYTNPAQTSNQIAASRPGLAEVRERAGHSLPEGEWAFTYRKFDAPDGLEGPMIVVDDVSGNAQIVPML